MRLNITFFLLLLLLGAKAQNVTEQPLPCNPVLMEKTQRELEQFAAELQRINANVPKAESTSHDNNWRGGAKPFYDTLFVVSGDTIKFETDTAGLFLDTLYLKEQNLKYGVGSPIYRLIKPSKTNEFRYSSNKGITINFDTLRIVLDYVQKNKKNDTLCYWIVIKRKNQNIRLPLITLNAEEDTILCVKDLKMTGKIVSSTITQCLGESIAKIKRNAYSKIDTCIYWQASRLGGVDTSTCFTICDEHQVCDNFLFPIQVIQKGLSAQESIVFMDDFSHNGPYPDPKKWLDDRVFVNNTMSSRPPSLGMATFDGLDYTGRPYGGSSGISDILTSTYLDFSTIKDSLFLSFFVEPKGLGFSPDVNDILELQFKDNTERWVTVRKIAPKRLYLPSEPAPGFTFMVSKIDPKYFYNGFQFRFRGYSSRTGINDVWNLDYVRISVDNPGRDTFPSSFSDISFTNEPASLFKNYNAMPWKHFKGFENKELNNQIPINIYSHFNGVQNINISNFEIKEEKSGQTLLDNYAFFPASLLNVPPKTFLSQTTPYNSTPEATLLAALQNIPASASHLIFKTTTSIQLSEENKFYNAVNTNNLATRTSEAANYFAYDDGTAESVISPEGSETQIQIQFNANVDDSLRAVLIHFPRFNQDLSNFRFNLRVFIGQLGKNPKYEKLFLRPDYPDKYSTSFQGFTRYILTDDDEKPSPIFIPKGAFYVGIQQVTTGSEPLVVGYDKNTPSARKYIYKNTTGIWQSLTGAGGAVMLRPQLSSSLSTILAIKEDATLSNINIYPNPAYDVLNIQTEGILEKSDFNYSIFDLSGRQLQNGQLSETIDIQLLESGFYIVAIQNQRGDKVFRQKIAVVK